MEAINKNIKNLRETLGLTQEEFSGFIDITSSHLSHIESGRRSPSIELFSRICQEFHITPNKLAGKNAD